jgi:hypothetical protein
MTRGICTYCGCTETAPCDGGCAWTDRTATVCTVCADAAKTATELVAVLGIAAAKGDVLTLNAGRFDALPTETQRFLVALCRTMVEEIRLGIAAGLNEEAVEAIRDLDRLSGFLLEHCAEDIGEDETAVDVALRKLALVTGSRLVMP